MDEEIEVKKAIPAGIFATDLRASKVVVSWIWTVDFGENRKRNAKN